MLLQLAMIGAACLLAALVLVGLGCWLFVRCCRRRRPYSYGGPISASPNHMELGELRYLAARDSPTPPPSYSSRKASTDASLSSVQPRKRPDTLDLPSGFTLHRFGTVSSSLNCIPLLPKMSALETLFSKSCFLFI